MSFMDRWMEGDEEGEKKFLWIDLDCNDVVWTGLDRPDWTGLRMGGVRRLRSIRIAAGPW